MSLAEFVVCWLSVRYLFGNRRTIYEQTRLVPGITVFWNAACPGSNRITLQRLCCLFQYETAYHCQISL